MKGFKLIVLAVAMSGLSGCVTTQEMQLAPNIVRLDTHAQGLLFTGRASSQTLRRAAELTLQNGYSHFRFTQSQVSHGTQLAGVSSFASGSAYGNTFGNSIYVSGYANGFSTPIYAPTSDVGVTVIMLHGPADGAFDARAVLSKGEQSQ